MQKPSTINIPERLSIMDRGMNMLDADLAEQEAKAHAKAVKRNGYAIPKEHQAMSSGALQAFEREHRQ